MALNSKLIYKTIQVLDYARKLLKMIKIFARGGLRCTHPKIGVNLCMCDIVVHSPCKGTKLHICGLWCPTLIKETKLFMWGFVVYNPYKWNKVTHMWTYGTQLYKMVHSKARVGLWH